MATVKFVNPNNTNYKKQGSWSATGPSGWESVSQNTIVGSPPAYGTADSNYIEKNSTNQGDYIVYPCQTPSGPGGDVPWRVRPKAEVTMVSGGEINLKCAYEQQKMVLEFGGGPHPVINYVLVKIYTELTPTYTKKGVLSRQWVTGDWCMDKTLLSVNPYRTTYDNHLPYLMVKIRDRSKTGGNVTRVWELGVEVEYTSVPVLTFASIDGDTTSTYTVTTTTKPKVVWNYTDTDGHDQVAYEIALVPQSTYDEAWFQDDLNSGFVIADEFEGSNIEHTLTQEIQSGINYRVYMRVAKQPGTFKIWSDWTFAQVNSAIDRPPAPTLAISANQTYKRINVDVTAKPNLLDYNSATGEDAASVGYWTNNTNIGGITSSNTVGGASGARAIRLAPAAAGTILAKSDDGTTGRVRVDPNTAYTIMGSIRSTTAGRTYRVGVRWLDSAGAAIGADVYSTTGSSTAAFVEKSFTATSPATAFYAVMLLEVQGTTGTTDYQYWDKMGIVPSSTGVWSQGGFTDLKAVIERSTNGVDGWEEILMSNDLFPTPSMFLEGYDFAAKRGVPAYYRAKIEGTTGTDAEIASDWSTVQNATINLDGTWWLQTPRPVKEAQLITKQVTSNVATLTTLEPHGFETGEKVDIANMGATYNGLQTITSVPSFTIFTYALVTADVGATADTGTAKVYIGTAAVDIQGWNEQVEENIGTFRPLGQEKMVTVAGNTYGLSGSFNAISTNAAEWVVLQALLQHQGTLLLSSPITGEVRWIRITDRDWEHMGTSVTPVRSASASYVNVASEQA